MKRFKEYEQNQRMLLPPSLEDMIGEKEMVRVVNRVIEEMGHAELLQRFSGGGCPSFNPIMMLKVLVYAYSCAMYSSRQIAKALKRDVAFMWISGMQKPDFRTINRFRSSYFKDSLQWAFAHVVEFLKKEGYVSGEEYFVDGTTIEANANKYSYVWRKCAMRYKERSQAKVKKIFDEIDRINREEDEKYGGKDLPEFGESADITSEKINEVVRQINEGMKKLPNERPAKEIKKRTRKIEKLKEKIVKYEQQIQLLDGRNSYSKTDADATFLRMKNKEIRAAYNLQVGSEKGFAVGFSVHQTGSDASTLVAHLRSRKKLGLFKPKRIVGDSAYGSEENYIELKKRRIGNFLKYPSYLREMQGKVKPFSASMFQRLDDEDAYLCPKGKKLRFLETKREPTSTGFMQTLKIYRCSACPHCPHVRRCCNQGSSHRHLSVNEALAVFRAQTRKNLASEKGIELRKRRGNESEGVFADIKFNRRFRRFSLRGKHKVTAEAALLMVAHNMRKIAALGLPPN